MLVRRCRPYLLALVFGLGAFIGAAPVMPAAAAERLPDCRYDDVLASNAAYSDWNVTLLDTTFTLRKDYQPPKLVSTSRAGLNGGGSVRSLVIPDLTAMAKAARNAGAGLRVVSAFRSYSYQQSVYRQEVRRYGESSARLTVARPGHSEHQLGVTIDFGSARDSREGWQYNDWGNTASGAWIRANGWKYGWVMSYPKNRRGVTCYRYEPWHWRYVGRDVAARVHDSSLTLREYLWAQSH